MALAEAESEKDDLEMELFAARDEGSSGSRFDDERDVGEPVVKTSSSFCAPARKVLCPRSENTLPADENKAKPHGAPKSLQGKENGVVARKLLEAST